MAKRKSNILIIAIMIIAISLMTAVGLVFAAYNVVIDHNYHFKAHADMLEMTTAGSLVTVTKRGGTELSATKCDIILISNETDGDITLNGVAASKHVTDEEAALRRSVFTDMNLTDDTTLFTASANVNGLKAAISEAVYTDAATSSAEYVKYDNIFVASQLDFKLMNFHTNYNNIFELWNSYQNKTISPRTVYLLTDIYITESYTVNIPCSIDLLDSRLIVGKDAADKQYGDIELKLAHSYPGVYYISALTEECIELAGGSRFRLLTPKALYKIADAAQFIEVAGSAADSSDVYIDELIEDALEFAARQLPDKFYSTVILCRHYQTYGLSYSYGLIDQLGNTIAEFNGAVSETPYPGAVQGLVRNAGTTSYLIRIYVTTKDGETEYLDKEVRVIGSSEAAMLQNILDNISGNYFTGIGSDSRLRLDINLLSLLMQEYSAGGFSKEITVSIWESEFGEEPEGTVGEPDENEGGAEEETYDEIVLKNPSAARLVISYDYEYYDDDEGIVKTATATEAARSLTLRYNGSGLVWEDGESALHVIKRMVINKGIATLSDKLFVKLTSSDSSSNEVAKTGTYDLAVSPKPEIMFYLKSLLVSFTTNRTYEILNIIDSGDDAGIYRGDTRLISSLLGLWDIENKLVLLKPENAEDPDSIIVETELVDILDRFYYNPLYRTYIAVSAKIDVDFLYLRYIFKFDENDEDEWETIYLPVIKSLSDDGGENQEFESSNPFDELFMSSETVWVKGGEFNVMDDKPNHYAYIEIVEVNGQEYNKLEPDRQEPLHKMVHIDTSRSLESEDPDDRRFDGILYTDSIYGNDYGELGEIPPIYSGVDDSNTIYYKKLRFVTDRNYVPDYNVSVKVRCWYLNSITPAIVLTQDYVIVVPGIFRCYDAAIDDPPPADASLSVFADRQFYDLTITLFEENYPDLYESYVSVFTEWDSDEAKRILLSDSAYASVNLDYSELVPPGEGVDIEGINRLKNVVTINLNNIEVSNTRAFLDMSDSALAYLYLKNCKMTDSALYGNGNAAQSYLYNLHLKEIDLSENSLTRTDKLLSRTVVTLDMSNQRGYGSGLRCLTDIAGLYNLTNLRVLDVTGNAILRFEVLGRLSTLSEAYIYDNIIAVAGLELYGTDGILNIPYYVASIKNFGTKICAYMYEDEDEGGNTVKTFVFMKIDRLTDNLSRFGTEEIDGDEGNFDLTEDTPVGHRKLSEGGNISKEQEIGSVVLNAFTAPTRIYTADAVWTLMYELRNLQVQIDNGVWRGDEGTAGYYQYMFYNPYGNPGIGTLSQERIAFVNKDGTALATVGTGSGWHNKTYEEGGSITFNPASVPVGTYSYMLAVLVPTLIESGNEEEPAVIYNVIAVREFLVEIASLA